VHARLVHDVERYTSLDRNHMIELGRITELQPGVFVTTLDMCTTAVLPSVLMPDVRTFGSWITGRRSSDGGMVRCHW